VAGHQGPALKAEVNRLQWSVTIRVLKVSKFPGPNGIPNRALKHLPQRAVSLLVLIFIAIPLTHHFPTALKDA
jgi:hypothetical protein